MAAPDTGGGGGGSGGSDGGKTTFEGSPDLGVDLIGPDSSDARADGAVDTASNPDQAPDTSPDRTTTDTSSDHGIDQAVDRSLEAAVGLDLGRADNGRPDGAPGDSSQDGVGILKLVAGHLGAPGAHDGIGPAARFQRLLGVTADGMGTLFVADSGNCTIRKVIIATREVTTLAGSAGSCESDDGIGSAARFSRPTDVAYDGAGNLFVIDSDTIRKVVIATGAVTTVARAGGDQGSADGHFSDPSAVACDGAGNLFVADLSVIHKMVIATGEVTILAGDLENSGHVDGVGRVARFTNPIALACDKAGNVFAAEEDTIRQIVAATGAVTTLPTNVSFSSLKDLTSDGAGNLFVADVASYAELKLRKVVIATGAVTTVADQDDAATTCPWRDAYGGWMAPPWIGVASDGAGSLFVPVEHNATICKVVVAEGTVTELASTAPTSAKTDGIGAEVRFESPQSLATDGAGNLLIADLCSIRKMAIASSEVTTLAGAPCSRYTAWSPGKVAGDRKGNLFFEDSGAISKMVIDTASITTLAGTSHTYGHQDGTGAAASFQRVTGIAYDGTGNLFVSEEGSQSIRKVDTASGTVITLAISAPSLGSSDGSVTSAALGQPAGLACDEAGSLFVADAGNCAIYKVVLATSTLTLLAGSPGNCGFGDGTAAARFLGPADMVSDGAGNLYVSDPPNHAIRKVAMATGTVTTVVGTPGPFDVVDLGPLPAHLNRPVGLTFEPGIGLFIADANDNAILLALLP